MCFCRSLSVGIKTGYRLFSVTAVDKLDLIHEGGNKESFRNIHLPSLLIHWYPPLPQAVVRFTLFTLLFSCLQTVLSVLYSSALKVTSGVSLSSESLTWSEMHTIKEEAPVFTFMKCAGLLKHSLLFHVDTNGKSLSCVLSGES